MKRNLSTPEHREFWDFVARVAKEVDSWPCWMKNTRCGKCDWCKRTTR